MSTSSRWLRCVSAVVLASCFSGAIASGRYTDYWRDVGRSHDLIDRQLLLGRLKRDGDIDDEIRSIAEMMGPNANNSQWKRLRDELELRSLAESGSREPVPRPSTGNFYGTQENKPSANWIEKGLQGFGEYMRRLLENRPKPAGAPAQLAGPSGRFPIQQVIYSALGISLIIALALLFRHVRDIRIDRRPKAATSEEILDFRLAGSKEWMQKAEAYQAAGDFRQAVRCAFMATLARCDELKLTPFVAADTNFEHVKRALRANAELQNLSESARIFDDVWYGARPASATDFTTTQEAWAQLGVSAKP